MKLDKKHIKKFCFLFFCLSNLAFGQNASESITNKSWDFPANFHKNTLIGDTLDLNSADWNVRLFFTKEGKLKRLPPLKMCGLEPKPKTVDKIRGKWSVEAENHDVYLVLKIRGSINKFCILHYSNDKLLLIRTE